MDNTFKSQIESASSVLVLLPTRPFMDQAAAGLALFLSLKSQKETAIACPSEMTVEFNKLVGVNKVTAELGNKNLVIKFKDYKATDIERVSYDIEGGEFRLSVIPKPGTKSPEKGQVDVSYSGITADTVILIGGANESHFPALSSKELTGAKKIHLGTRSLSIAPEHELISFARPLSSVSELVGALAKESGWDYDADIATNLLIGIQEGSNNFSSDSVTADTFQMVADLIRAGGKREGKRVSREEFPQGSIPGEPPGKSKKPPKDWTGPKIYKGTSIS
jgi:hypothetical protein